MLTLNDLVRRRRRVYATAAAFLGLSAFLCFGSYFGWFGWYLWGKPKPPPRPVVAEGDEATAFARRLLKTEARYAQEDVRKVREVLGKLSLAKDSRHNKYAQEFQYKLKREPEPLSTLGVANPTPEQIAAATSPVDDADLIELYGVACHLDKRLHDVYRLFRTCELARIQHLSLREAYDVTDVVAPSHQPADLALLRGQIVSTAGEEMKRFKGELARIKVEIKAILGTAMRMIDLAAVLEPGILGVGSFWDFSQGDGDFYRINALIERPRSLYEGQTGQDPRAFEHEWGRGEGPITKKELGLPVELGIDLSKTMPLPGRKLMARGRGAEWMFINAWYIIGPFPNPNRQNLEKKFPPEASVDPKLGFLGIDLDATFVGMANKAVRWEYLATDRRVCFIPAHPQEWAIWYAYTEIWSETEQDKFCIFGSDDFGKCWINAEEVYISGVTPHPWIPDRKYAKVHFRQGFNPVLFKLENAWGRTGFSLCVYTGKVPTAGNAPAKGSGGEG